MKRKVRGMLFINFGPFVIRLLITAVSLMLIVPDTSSNVTLPTNLFVDMFLLTVLFFSFSTGAILVENILLQ